MINGIIGQSHENIVLAMSCCGMVKKANAAMLVCGGLLGECYILMEVIDGVMVDAMAEFSKQKWFKQNIKKQLKNAHKILKDNIRSCKENSKSNVNVMTELSDQMYDALKLDIYKMKNVALNETHKQNEQYANDIAQFIVLEILLQVVGLRYESVIEHMQKVFQTDYDKLYYNSSAKNVLAAFDKAKSEFSKRYVATEIKSEQNEGADYWYPRYSQ